MAAEQERVGRHRGVSRVEGAVVELGGSTDGLRHWDGIVSRWWSECFSAGLELGDFRDLATR